MCPFDGLSIPESEYRRDFLEKDKDGQYQPTAKTIYVRFNNGTIITHYINSKKTESEICITINPEGSNWVKYIDRIKDGKREFIRETSLNSGTITQEDFKEIFMVYYY